MNRTLTVLLIVSLAANVFLGGFVAGRMIGGPPHRNFVHSIDASPGFKWRMGENLSALSPEARDAFRKAFGDSRERLVKNFRETRRLRQALSDALAADPWSRAEVEAALADLRAADNAQQAALAELMVDAFEGLSAADRKALVEAMEKRGRPHEMRMRMRDEFRGPGERDRDRPGPPPDEDGDDFVPPGD